MIARAGRALLLLAALAAACAPTGAQTSIAESIPGETSQLLLVTTGGWDSTSAILQRYERQARQGEWRPVGEPMPAIVGRNGLAAGSGLAIPSMAGPRKHEGDGRAPAGLFALGPAFGYAPPGTLPRIRLPYLRLTPGVECIDDMGSPRYNTIADTTEVAEEWKSSEAMSRAGRFYEWGIVVRHNADPVRAGDGSCIFIHVWGGPAVTTSGCTALDSSNVVELIGWLDPARRPLLLQLPATELRRLGSPVPPGAGR